MSLKLLVTCDAVGGVWTYALELARALEPWGVTTHLAVLGPGPDAHQRRAAHAVRSLHVRSAGFELEWTDDPWDDVDAAGDWLLELADELRPDVVHLNGYAHGALPFGVPKVVVAHSCVLSWWRAVKGEEAPERYATYRARVRAGIAGADALVAPTRAFLDTVQALHGGKRASFVVPNGISMPPLPSPTGRADVVLAAGRVWDAAKGLDVLDAAADGLAWPVWIAGDSHGPRPGVGGPRHARGLGQLSRASLRARMARAAIFCHPARYEPFGLAPLEAAAAGCALVLADIPTLRELWDGAAVFVPPGDAVALRDALDRLITSPAEVRRLADAATRRAQRYDTSTQAAAYLALYRHLIEARVGTPREPAVRLEAVP
jgi:glycosyltransferase involved in cell wall biosynthesis